MKDRIHYFLSYEYEREPQTYVYATPYPKFNGELTGTRRQDTEMGRFDFQFSPSKRLSLRGNRVRQPHPVRLAVHGRLRPDSRVGDRHQPPVRAGVRHVHTGDWLEHGQ